MEKSFIDKHSRVYLKVAGYGNKILDVFSIFLAVFSNAVKNFLGMALNWFNRPLRVPTE